MSRDRRRAVVLVMLSGPTHVLERSQRIEVPASEAFEFFADARNLERITPEFLGFSITTKGEIEMHAGTLIDYQLRLRGIPLRWRTRIEVWEPPRRFVDLQLRGPYDLWEHTHTFIPDGADAVVIADRVRYALPLGPLGELAHRLLVRRDLERIFDHRHSTVARLLGPAAA